MAHTRTSSKANPTDRRSGPASEAVEDYVKAIYAIAERGQGAVSTTALAERLGVAPSSVTAMCRRLDEMGLSKHEPYRGVELTPAGQHLALEVIRHHRLIELFLVEALGMPWDRVHDEAEVLEHYISEEVERRIAERLGDPARDPHGDPIPSPDFDVAADRTVPLSALDVGRTGRFTRVSDSDSRMLRYLDARDIRPGALLVVRGVEPFGGPVRVEVGGVEYALGPELVARMRVEAEPADAVS
ncbi:MAG: DtxR family transcriptional regulator, Mn-dependent transcriptional regulator [Solirubrobacterales bacterium]|nr:DtxR family transcriptional regulator, Mn-dependent transcriptional regulator [Solirubrobacterales bacterium]